MDPLTPASDAPFDSGPEVFTDQLRSAIAADFALVEDLKPEKERKDFYVFFSFDLVNSTLYKTRRPSDWPIVTQRFYEQVEEGLRKHAGQIRLWKYVGDELLLYRRIRNRSEMRECVSAARTTLDRVVSELARIAPEGRSLLSVKATLWCALVHELSTRAIGELPNTHLTNTLTPRNLLVRQPDAAGQGQVDFLGTDIDIGFRIARFASRQRMVVSADLAYLLYRDRASDDELEHQLKIVSYEQLKGVWAGRRYPIFWYERSWASIKTSFDYDEGFDSEIVRRLIEKGPLADLSHVVKINADTDRTMAAQDLWAFVDGLTGEDVELAPAPLHRDGAEVHCVAVCFRRDDGRALIARRAAAKRRYPQHWEFGCGQLRPYETFGACLRRAYLEDFGANLSVPDAPVPVSTFMIADSDEGPIPGIVFVAEVLNPEALKARKHEDIEWTSVAEIDMDRLGNVVPQFAETLQIAQTRWQGG